MLVWTAMEDAKMTPGFQTLVVAGRLTVLLTKRRSLFSMEKNEAKEVNAQASLVAQWLRIRLPMQGTRVRALVQEDPTCRGATKPVRHNY